MFLKNKLVNMLQAKRNGSGKKDVSLVPEDIIVLGERKAAR